MRSSACPASPTCPGGSRLFGLSQDQATPAYDRQLLLLGPKRNVVLDLAEVHRDGSDSYGDPDYVAIFGLTPAEWYARGIRLLGRK